MLRLLFSTFKWNSILSEPTTSFCRVQSLASSSILLMAKKKMSNTAVIIYQEIASSGS
jgi:hypothetical protein